MCNSTVRRMTLRLTLIAAATLFSSLPVFAELPDLGSANASSAQLEQEHELGRAWVRLVKKQVNLIDEPVIAAYLKQLTWRLVPYSSLQDKRLEILIIDNKEINAFAAPGGIIGIHAGLLASSQHEDELASVIAHEFAHLSQRHFAQQQSAAEQRAPLVMAGLLGGILLAGVSPDAGAAAMHGTLGASASAQLAFSRKHELDADQTGMQTLVAAGLDPHAMPRMFMLLQEASRYSAGNVPEFLRTHPVTEARISDSTNRAAQLSRSGIQTQDPDSYLIAKARAEAHFGFSPGTDSSANSIALYNFFSAVKKADSAAANTAWQKLPELLQLHPWAELGLAELALAKNQLSDAKSRIDELYALYPDDQAIQRAAASFWMKTGALAQSAQMYRDLIRDYPTDPELWYQLAELYGLLKQPDQLHRARIEYFLLVGDFDLALRQVEFARRDTAKNSAQLSWLNQRESEIISQRDEMDRLLN